MEKGFGLVERFKIGEPLFLKNLVLFPLTDGDKDFGRLEILSEAKEKNHLEIMELGVPRIDTIFIKNNSKNRIFALDGEGLRGALQDRVINSSALIKERSEVEIPVSCVEAGRWRGDKEFSAFRTISYPSLRSILCKSVSLSLRKTKKFQADQTAVWNSISSKMNSLKVYSQTSSIHDIYSQLKKRLESYKEGLAEIKDWNGLIVLSGERILCIDLFGSKRLFNKLKEPLITSYALDALERNVSTLPRRNWVKKAFEEIKDAKVASFPSFSLGNEIRLETENMVGRGLVIDGELLHFSAFDRVRR